MRDYRVCVFRADQCVFNILNVVFGVILAWNDILGHLRSPKFKSFSAVYNHGAHRRWGRMGVVGGMGGEGKGARGGGGRQGKGDEEK